MGVLEPWLEERSLMKAPNKPPIGDLWEGFQEHHHLKGKVGV